MIQEAYVSYKISKLLKEKGFNSPCQAIWYDDRIVLLAHLIDNNSLLLTDEYKFSRQKESLITIPTHQMAMAWLREIKNIVIIPEIHTTTDPKDYYWGASIYYLDKPWDLVKWISEPSKGKCNGYDEVIEAALKYSLENLL